jgi:twitching motility protein PilT
MQTTLTAAETGHLVFSTLHTNSASQSIDRIIDSCPSNLQKQIRSQVALVLRAIVSMKLIEKSDGTGLLPVVEILVNSPKIAKHIEVGETKEIQEEMETSVAYYRMQTMNQSLIALLVNGQIDYGRAMELSTDPEDLSLKLRKLFPQIEERGKGDDMASVNDFSHISRLMETKTLYEQQEHNWRMRLTEKDEEIAKQKAETDGLRRAADERHRAVGELEAEITKLRAENERLTKESMQKIAQLNERIKELNQRVLIAEGGGRMTARR